MQQIMAENLSEKNNPVSCRSAFQTKCGNCRLNSICLPIALQEPDLDSLDRVIHRNKPLRKGEHVFRENDNFTAIYAIRSGFVKAYRLTDDGKEQVTGFYFPGEIIGLDGISQNKHSVSAKALETAAICEIPFEDAEALSSRFPSMQRHLFSLMSQEIIQDQQLITLLSKNTAEERISALILSISDRNAARKLSPTSFRLPMSRTDIGNYLGLTVETVSRVFSRFQKNGTLEVNNKEITILDIDQLRGIVTSEA
ncbi:CRP/FNR family transcriptional regulator [Sinobacterium caligoides]|jgi:CRP/FNR family transcriptional regulator|uniref:CRP/FNR family transcriptional regulator n=1 Tax=Sinobacterium caligoides TaxID=933926 RepID=A0A3N2DZK6_9GAMM|nr:fumarate/nitrate reduction transcriptional regulator Fnr [Sinobacterium caligoides]ROS05274.1 CRP/FNR family transcriptional regulator [Sinobacterium caligoides]